MQYTFRPLPTWPHTITKPRQEARFKAPWSKTLLDLEHEIKALNGKNAIIGAGFRETDLRRDGMPRSDRRQAPYMHPGVEVSFDSRLGRLAFATDEFTEWQDNVRAVALSMQALRAVDRYGVSKRGQQFAGFAQLTAGGPDPARGQLLVERVGGMNEAMKRYHPDHGGEQRDMVDVLAFRDQQRAALS